MIKPLTEIKPEAATEPAATPTPDPFDLDNLRLDQSFAETAGVKKLLHTVPVGRPNPQDFVRIHPGQDYRDAFALIELAEDREYYILPPNIAREMPGEFFTATLYTCINRQGVVRVVPVRLAGPGRQGEPVAPVPVGRGAGRHAPLDSHQGQHGVGRVRGIRGRGRDPRTDMAGSHVPGIVEGWVPRPRG